MRSASISLLLCLMISLILLPLSVTASKQPNLFSSLYELIAVKSSARVAVFLTFNVTIIVIFRSRVKPSTEDFDPFLSFPHLVYEAEADGRKDEAALEDYDCSDIEDGDDFHGYDGYDEDSDDDGSNDEDDDNDDEQDKDLERRIEEFIAKNYKQRQEQLIYERLLCMHAA